MHELSPEDVKIIKSLAASDVYFQEGMSEDAKIRLDEQIGPILREYYHENTRFAGDARTEQFARAGISKDDGKSAIACARRLGIDIS